MKMCTWLVWTSHSIVATLNAQSLYGITSSGGPKWSSRTVCWVFMALSKAASLCHFVSSGNIESKWFASHHFQYWCYKQIETMRLMRRLRMHHVQWCCVMLKGWVLTDEYLVLLGATKPLPIMNCKHNKKVIKKKNKPLTCRGYTSYTLWVDLVCEGLEWKNT